MGLPPLRAWRLTAFAVRHFIVHSQNKVSISFGGGLAQVAVWISEKTLHCKEALVDERLECGIKINWLNLVEHNLGREGPLERRKPLLNKDLPAFLERHVLEVFWREHDVPDRSREPSQLLGR